MIMKERKALKNLILVNFTLCAVMLCGCSGCGMSAESTEGTIYYGAEVPGESASKETFASETSITEEPITQTSVEQTENSQAPSVEEPSTQTVNADKNGVKYEPPIVINQRTTAFGDMGCGGAAALMAMQALGIMTDIDTDAEFASFWNTVPKSYDPNKGWSNNYGIWNPAYCSWVDDYTETERIQNYSTADIKKYLEAGSTVIPLVSLGDSGNYTHWFVVYGYYERDGAIFYYVADPWGGGLREYTEKKLYEKIQEAARRKGGLGYGYETEGIVVSK